jgi:hypothetical protein
VALSNDGSRLITGDVQGVVYIWLVSSDDCTMKTLDLHKDKGGITNIVAIQRPLSLYGLTANMSGYEPNQIKQLQR